jgi:hypothetical protein
MKYLNGELRKRAIKEVQWLANLLENDLDATDFLIDSFADVIRKRAEDTARAIERLAESAEDASNNNEFFSMFTHRGRIHVKFPPAWVQDTNPLYAYSDSLSGPVAYVYFTAVGKAYKLWEESSLAAGIGQPTPMVEPVDPSTVEWSEQPPSIFEPLEKIRIYGGSNSPIYLE